MIELYDKVVFYLKKIAYILLVIIFITSTVYADDTAYSPVGDRIAHEAALWLGTPYGYSDGSDGYGSEVDCSGLVMQVYKAFGVELSRNSMLQAKEGQLIPLNEMIAGDIVCFMYEDGSIGHVGIFVGGNTMIHSPRPEKTVEFSSYFEDWGSIKAVYGRRILTESDYVPEPLSDEISAQLIGHLSTVNKVRTDHLEGIDYMPIDINAPKTIILQIDNPLMNVNGKDKPIEKSGDVAPFISNGRTLLPLRKVAEEFGAEVNWIDEEKKINLIYKDNQISLWIDSDGATVNGEFLYLDSAPVIVNGKTYLPIRFIADSFGWELDWNGHEKTVTLSVNQDNYSNSDTAFN